MSEESGSYVSSEKRKPSPPPVRVERIETEGTIETMGTETTTAELPPSSPLKLNPRSRAQTTGSIDLDDYFVGPRDLNKHSKWPMFMRMHGSILPKMILPLTIIGGWATLFTCISKLVKPLGVDSILLTILGFVVGLALSFRSSSAYERYAEGRKYWAQLMLTAQNLARVIWLHAEEREGEEGKRDLLAKLTALNLINAFAVALKHKLRFEPLTSYEDLCGLVDHLDTFAKEAEDEALHHPKKTPWKATGEYLGVSFAESNPRKLLKKSKKPLGNLPLEILSYLSAYLDSIMQNETLRLPIYQTHAVNSIQSFNEILAGCDRVLSTPLPIAYSIAISQITYTYVLLLPFQLFPALGWVTIPGTIAAAYIILGIALIGREIENPFGNDVNDLPLDTYCEQVAADLDVISSVERPTKNVDAWLRRDDNLPLWPLSMSGFRAWEYKSESQIREALKLKANLGTSGRKSSQVSRQNGDV